jgi:uncharacterized protein with HEPN domain
MREHLLFLDDIIEAISRVETYSKGLSRARLEKNAMAHDAIIRNLEIIGEAVKNIPPETKKNNPQIEWKKIAGLRDILAHEYFGVDVDVVWDIIENKIPVLKSQILLLMKHK